MSDDDDVILTRDCSAIAVPGGYKLTLRQSSRVQIRQATGGRFVVATSLGQLVRVDAGDAGALGRRPEDAATQTAASAPSALGSLESRVWAELRNCFDPEIPVNIVDFGLVYGVHTTVHEGGGYDVTVDLTLTAPGCGMGEVLARDIETRLRALPDVASACVQLVFDPPWDASRMSEAARLQLGL